MDIRNLAAEPITIETHSPGRFLFPIVDQYTIQPWREGQCFAHLGFGPGRLEIHVSGGPIAIERVYSMTTPSEVAGSIHVGVQVMADGEVQFGGPFPADQVPCQGGGY